MLQKEFRRLCFDISTELAIPLEETTRILDLYRKKIGNRVKDLKITEALPPIATGIPALDKDIRLYPGVTIIYSRPSGGRTSLAKRLALGAYRQGLSTVYYDVENKLVLSDISLFTGIVVARSYQDSGLKELVNQGLVDCIIVDTITGIYPTSQESFLINIRKKVPYVILITQMRDAPDMHKTGPAARNFVVSAAHTAIYLMSTERKILDGIDCMRVQYRIDTYNAHRSTEKTQGSFIVRNSLADPIATIYEYVRHGKLCPSSLLYPHILTDRKEALELLRSGLKAFDITVPLEVYDDSRV